MAAYRFPYLLAGDSVVLKQDSEYYEHFYKRLSPWKHYIPLKHDLSDLLEKIQWARDHDAEVCVDVLMCVGVIDAFAFVIDVLVCALAYVWCLVFF